MKSKRRLGIFCSVGALGILVVIICCIGLSKTKSGKPDKAELITGQVLTEKEKSAKTDEYVKANVEKVLNEKGKLSEEEKDSMRETLYQQFLSDNE